MPYSELSSATNTSKFEVHLALDLLVPNFAHEVLLESLDQDEFDAPYGVNFHHFEFYQKPSKSISGHADCPISMGLDT